MVLLSTAYFAPIAYYALLFHEPEVMIEAQENYNKQSYRNRMFIGTDQGPLPLSVNVEKGYATKCPIKEVKLSGHGDWLHQHEIALMSNYGSTPFYEYYIEDILKILHSEDTLFGMNEKLRNYICELIGFHPNVKYTEEYIPSDTPGLRDLRNTLHPKKDIVEAVPEFKVIPYYQVVGQRHEFMPNLSILDLLFNMGPESILVLSESIKKNNRLFIKQDICRKRLVTY